MVAVHHLKMLHAIVLSTDIETQRHSSSEGVAPFACCYIDRRMTLQLQMGLQPTVGPLVIAAR